MESPRYEEDFLLGAETQAAILRTGNLSALDTEGLQRSWSLKQENGNLRFRLSFA